MTDAIIDSQGHFTGECGNDGPAALRDIDSDGDTIPDACDPCPQVPDAQYRDGIPQADGTIRFGVVGDYVNDDFDQDGVPDICDSCPTVANGNRIVDALGRLAQPDDDFDNIGNACDGCPVPHTLPDFHDMRCCATDADCPAIPGRANPCLDIAPQVGSICSLAGRRCAVPDDRDGDRRGDLCDNCPTERNPDQDDTDGDTAGDVCDNCPGLSAEGPQDRDRLNAFLPCPFDPDDPAVGDPTCAAIHPATADLPAGSCVPPTPAIPAHCTKMEDADGDGVGDACDNCPDIPNRDESGTQRNCNRDSERANGIEYPGVGDVCDRVPCPEFLPVQPPERSGVDIFDGVGYSPILLPPGQTPDAFDFAGTPTATVGGRFCECEPPGVRAQTFFIGEDGQPERPIEVPTAEECVAIGPCPLADAADQYDDPNNLSWEVPELHPINPNNTVDPAILPGAEVDNVRFTVPFGVNPPATGELLPYFSFGAPPSAWNVGSSARAGIYWNHIPSAPALLDPNTGNPVPPDTYRDLSNHYTGSIFGSRIFDPGVIEDFTGALILDRCRSTLCNFRCLTGLQCPPDIDDPLILVQLEPDRLRFGMLTQESLYDVRSPFVLDGLVQMYESLQNRDRLFWAGMAERGAFIRPDQLTAVAIARNGTDAPFALRVIGAGLDAPLSFRSSSVEFIDTALYATEQLSINDGTQVLFTAGEGFGQVASFGGDINVGVDADVGAIWSGGTVTLRDRAGTHGVVRAADSVFRQNLLRAFGPIVAGANVGLPGLDGFDVDFPAPSGGSINVEPDGQQSADPGSYDAVTVKSRATLDLSAGTYHFRSLSVEPDATVTFDTSTGPVFLFIDTAFTYRGAFVDGSGAHDNVFAGYFGTTEAAIEAPFSGTLVAPNAKITLASVTPGHFGAFIGRSVEVHQHTTVTHQPFAHDWELPASAAPRPIVNEPPEPRSGFGAVVSSVEESLFIIGGVLESGLPALDIRQFYAGQNPLYARSWVRLPLSGIPPAIVLAATYRPEDRALYFFDDIDGNARLLRYDLATGTSTVLGAWDRNTIWDRHFLVNTEDGNMVLLAGSTATNTHVGVVLEVGAGTVSELWQFSGAGLPIAGPALTTDGLTVTVASAAAPLGVENLFVPADNLPTAQAGNLGNAL